MPPKLNWRWVIGIVVSIGIIVWLIMSFINAPETLALTDIAAQIRSGDPAIATITITDQQIDVAYVPDHKSSVAYIASSSSLLEQLYELNVSPEQLNGIKIEYKTSNQMVLNIFLSLFPIILIIFFLILMMRRSNQMPKSVTDFVRTPAQKAEAITPDTKFHEVIGAEDAKMALMNLVMFLNEPERFINLGARLPRGILLIGPAGTGKTLLARALAGEAGIKFFPISGAEFVEMFVGVGASRVRNLFERAKAESPAIIFIDEIDAIGKKRGGGFGSGANDEREQTLNELLIEMDGFDELDNVIVIAATNRVDVLDPALLRPGRFDHKIFVPLPGYQERKAILDLYLQGKPLAPDVRTDKLAQKTPGKSGADLEAIVSLAARLAGYRYLQRINHALLEDAAQQLGMTLPDIEDTGLIEEKLSEAVSGQYEAKAILAKAAFLHYQFFVREFDNSPHPIHNSNLNHSTIKPTVLLLGPSGTGKTLLSRTLAQNLGLPFVSIEVEKLDFYQFGNKVLQKPFQKLLRSAHGDISKAQYGIIVVEGIEKLRGDDKGQISLWSKQIQENLLEFIRGEEIDVSLTGDTFDSNPVLFNTSHVLFVCEGNFGQASQKIAADPRLLIGMGFTPELVSCFSLHSHTNPLRVAHFMQMLDPEWAGSSLQKYQNLLALQQMSMDMPSESCELLATAATQLGLDGRFINLMLYQLWHLIVEGKRHHNLVDQAVIQDLLRRWDSSSVTSESLENSISLAELDHLSHEEIKNKLL